MIILIIIIIIIIMIVIIVITMIIIIVVLLLLPFLKRINISSVFQKFYLKNSENTYYTALENKVEASQTSIIFAPYLFYPLFFYIRIYIPSFSVTVRSVYINNYIHTPPSASTEPVCLIKHIFRRELLFWFIHVMDGARNFFFNKHFQIRIEFQYLSPS